MGAFEYKALDRAGKQSKGLIEGDTAKHVRQLLRERNLVPVAVTEVAEKTVDQQSGFRVRRGMKASELALITRQLASLSQSGLPLEEALLAVSQQNDTPRTKSILLGVRSKVMRLPGLHTGRHRLERQRILRRIGCARHNGRGCGLRRRTGLPRSGRLFTRTGHVQPPSAPDVCSKKRCRTAGWPPRLFMIDKSVPPAAVSSMNVYFGIRPETPAELATIAANTLLAHVL